MAEPESRMGKLDSTSLHEATRSGNLARIQQLLQSGTSVDARDEELMTPLHIAAWNGQAEAAGVLIKAGASVDLQVDDGRSAIWMAAGNGHAEVVDELIRAHVSVDMQEEDGYSPLLIAAQNGHDEVVKKLIHAQASVDLQNCQGISPIHMAAQNGHDEVVEMLIRAQAIVDIQGQDGSTPMYFAAQIGHAKVIEKLIRATACVNLLEENGHSPLYVAAQGGYTDAAEKLIGAQASVDLQAHDGCSPLYIAAGNGHAEIVGMLIRAHALLDLQAEDGHSALYAAAKNGHCEAAASLMSSGANLQLESHDGVSPVAAALRNGHSATADRLLAACEHQYRIRELSLFTDAICCQFHGDVFLPVIEKFCSRQECSQLVSTRSSELFANAVLGFLDHRSNKLVENSSGPRISSQDLHAVMLNSGFCAVNARLQSATASVLEDIIILMGGKAQALVVGSWADGWGSCLTRLNGAVDLESDIDVTDISHAAPIHVCRNDSDCCISGSSDAVKYEDGHIEFSTPVTTPSRPERGSALKPAMDYVMALPCCSYPDIYPLRPSHKSQIPQPILNDLRSMLSSTRCHVVSAAPPGLEGQRMRVSTNMLERKLMRSLGTVQGQLFLILKYLMKVVLTGEMSVKGLKTYHAKSLLFYMFDEMPEKKWRPEKLIELVKESLEMLLRHLSEGGEHQCMRHFFLRDAAVYLRKGHLCKQGIADAVASVIGQLPQVLAAYSQTLMPSETGFIIFHPFLALPDLWHRPRLNFDDIDDTVQYHEIDHALQALVICLSDEQPFVIQEHELQLLLQEISKIPDSARTARESLRVMAHLRAGDKDGAVEVLNRFVQSNFQVSRGVRCDPSDPGMSADEAKALVWKQLNETDSAWKFCLQIDDKPEFSFFPLYIREAFPWPAGNYSNVHYLNFDALMKGLQLEFVSDKVSAAQLFQTVFLGDADPQEILMVMRHCQDEQLLVQAIHANSDVIRKTGLTDHVIKFVQSRPTLQQKCFLATINSAIIRAGGRSASESDVDS